MKQVVIQDNVTTAQKRLSRWSWKKFPTLPLEKSKYVVNQRVIADRARVDLKEDAAL
jgi:hypothetical protein